MGDVLVVLDHNFLHRAPRAQRGAQDHPVRACVRRRREEQGHLEKHERVRERGKEGGLAPCGSKQEPGLGLCGEGR